MDKEVRNTIQRATQRMRALLETEYAAQLEGTFDIFADGTVNEQPGAHLDSQQVIVREKLVGAIGHIAAKGQKPAEAVATYLREASFTFLNRLVALKLAEARGLLQECVSRGDQSSGFREFCGLAPGISSLPDKGYRLFVECLFDGLSTEIKVLFDRRDPASLLWPRRQALLDLLTILNAPELANVWVEDETLGWVYQFFNSGDERRRMRDESQAPRNSHELAVRNQFFTPRYVVQFLTDNTLGRIWSEMRGGDTALAERCSYLVRDRETTSTRPKKDPRDIKLLDPAGGSGHFLLYSFDLFLTIYDEAWQDQGSPKSKATGCSLREDYPGLELLRSAVPALILHHNLHAVDIDARCAQIAALALWMRAQRAYNDFGVPASDRAPITRIHVVVAEPMPGDETMVESFAARLEPPLLGALFKKMVGEMRLAGELGTLLRVEDGIAVELRRAREQFVAREKALRTGFLPGMEPPFRQGELDLSGIDDARFFHQAEARIVEALRGFAEAVAGSVGVRRRLFAGDAAQGIALIDLVQTLFDVVLMNPPFGAGSLAAKEEFERSYPRTKNDLYAAFVERGIQLLHDRGMLGAITSRTGFFLSSFQKWREEILLNEAQPLLLADLGLGVMDDALVEAAAYCLEKRRPAGLPSTTKTIVFRVLEELNDKQSALIRAIANPEGVFCFEVNPASFSAVPGAPFAYWTSDQVRRLFEELPSMESAGRVARRGVNTNDDFRFLRLAWEVGGTPWAVHVKGGAWSPFYADPHMLLNWGHDGAELLAERVTTRVYKSAIVPSRELYFRPGVTWTRRTKRNLSVRVMPEGCIFGDKGPAAALEGDDHDELLALLAVMNSKVFMALVELQLAAADAKPGGAARSYEVGVLQGIPLPDLAQGIATMLADHGRAAWSWRKIPDTANETSHSFVLPALLQVVSESFEARSQAWRSLLSQAEREVAQVRNEIDNLCFSAYGIGETDRRTISEGFSASTLATTDENNVDCEVDAEVETDESAASAADAASLATEFLSWAVGVAFGRFDVRLATGDRPLPTEPGPFDRLPSCSPAMLTGGDGLPLTAAPAGYPLTLPEVGLLADDPGHARDLTAAVREVFDVVFGADADARWNEALGLLGPKDRSLRNWLATGFFEHHLRRYSRSRRKAPIYWPLATSPGSFTVWVYYHRFTRDTLFKVLNDFVKPKLEVEERRLLRSRAEAGPNPTSSQQKDLTAQEAFVEELLAFREEVARVAPLWNPDFNDGVLINFAPLWRLVPHHRAWQKECKDCWDKLVAGDYDWAHLAMHLWPERVVPKCASDRSLAIAHGLEEVFWTEVDNGKWKPRAVSTSEVEGLIAQRSSPTVKAALESLLAAPMPGGSASGRRGRPRGRKANGT